jgi:hypothetical protein
MTRLFQAEGAAAIDRWLKVLKAGGTLKALEFTKLADVDMPFPTSIHKAVASVGSSEATHEGEMLLKQSEPLRMLESVRF